MSYVGSLGGVDIIGALKRFDSSYITWKLMLHNEITNQLVTGDKMGYGKTMQNWIASADRLHDAFLNGDAAKGQALQKVMEGAVETVRELRSPNLPSVVDVFNTTIKALQDAIVAASTTVGKTVGSALKSAADAAGVSPSSIPTVAVAIAVGLAAIAAIKLAR